MPTASVVSVINPSKKPKPDPIPASTLPEVEI
jgi:hypothetical protein